MFVIDPIADMLTRIRNATMARHERVKIPYSKLKEKIARILKNEGYIYDFKISKKGIESTINIILKYFSSNKRSVICGLKRISKPGRRVYSGVEDIPRVLRGLGTAVVSTSKGIFTDKECRANKVGGEVLFYVW